MILRALVAVGAWINRPRIAPRITAEVTIIMADNGHIAVFLSKLADEEKADAICGNMVNALLAQLSVLGRTINMELEDGTVVPLVRPRRRRTG